jgi:hypothetical protein
MQRKVQRYTAPLALQRRDDELTTPESVSTNPRLASYSRGVTVTVDTTAAGRVGAT